MPANLDEASAVASAIRRSIRMSVLARKVTRLSCARGLVSGELVSACSRRVLSPAPMT